MTDDLKMTPEMDLELEEFFAVARDEAPVPSANLLAKISNDALKMQEEFDREALPEPSPRVRWWRQLFDEIGGLPAMGGLAACACAGVYLGFVNPDFATTWAVEETAEVEGVMSHALLGDVYWIEEG